MAITSNKDASFAHAPQINAGASWQTERVTPFLRERTDRALALKRVLPTQEAEAEALPMLATAGDVREVVRLLKRKAGGITIIEGMDAIKRVFDPRKVAAYEYWGLITRKGDRLSLSALGWEFARKLEPEARLFRAVLSATLAYRSALEWVFRQRLEIVTDADVVRFWLEHPAQVFLCGNQKTFEGNVVCFFHLCQEAELGMATIGKRGQRTRLRVDHEELAAYIGGNSSSTSDDELALQSTLEESATESLAPAATVQTAQDALEQLNRAHASGKMRVFISCRKDEELAQQLRMALEMAEIESEVSRRTESNGAQLVPDEIFGAMRRCDTAIIVVSSDDCRVDDKGSVVPDASVLMEISVAMVHYNRRVILLWEESVPVPAQLSELCRCEFAANNLTWESGMQLLKAVRSFKS